MFTVTVRLVVNEVHRTLLANSQTLFATALYTSSTTIKPSLYKMPEPHKQYFHSRSALISANEISAQGSHLPRVHLTLSTIATPIPAPGSVRTETTSPCSHSILPSVFSRYPISTSNFAFALGGHHSSPTAKPPPANSNGFAPPFSITAVTSMGQSRSIIRSSIRSSEPCPTSRRHTLSSLGRPNPTPTTKVIPNDNIFVPIQLDDVMGQVPIHLKHPLPRTGIEDGEDKPIQTNRFYANAFLGKQDQPVWAQPYVLWWGKGGSDLAQFATWGMNVGHAESGDLVFGPGDPPKVCESYLSPSQGPVNHSSLSLTCGSTTLHPANNWSYLAQGSCLKRPS